MPLQPPVLCTGGSVFSTALQSRLDTLGPSAYTLPTIAPALDCRSALARRHHGVRPAFVASNATSAR